MHKRLAVESLDDKARTAGYIRIAEAAETAGVSIRTMWRWASEGRVTAAKIGPRTYVRRDSLMERLGPLADA